MHKSYRGALLAQSDDSEKSLSACIRARLEKDGCKVFSTELRHRPVGRSITPGVPDLIVFHPDRGRFTFVELKTPSGKLRQRQVEFRDYCYATDTPWSVWRSVKDAEEWLDG